LTLQCRPAILDLVHPSRAPARTPALWVSLFALVAVAGMVVREWSPLSHLGTWAGTFRGPGDFPPDSVVQAVLHGQSVGAAYAANVSPYPLPYLIAFVPIELLGDP
jgi:hypothetical protein